MTTRVHIWAPGRPQVILPKVSHGAAQPEADSASMVALRAALAEAQRLVDVAYTQVRLAKSKAEARRARRQHARLRGGVERLQAAILAEHDGEHAAPSVRREEIRKGNTVLREPQVQMVGKRAELTPALERLHRRGTISQAEYRAGRRYREAYEAASLDLYPIGLGGDGGRSVPSSGNRRIEEAVASSVELQVARRGIGMFGSDIVNHVVIEGLTMASWAEKKGESEFVVTGVLKAVLQRLAEVWLEFDGTAHVREAAVRKKVARA